MFCAAVSFTTSPGFTTKSESNSSYVISKLFSMAVFKLFISCVTPAEIASPSV